MARRLHLDVTRLRYALDALAEVCLIERVDLPDFEALRDTEEDVENVSKDSKEVSRPYEKDKGKGKETASGNGLREKRKKNGKKKQGAGQASAKGKASRLPEATAEPPSPPTATPPLLPTEADAQGVSRSDMTEHPLRSDMSVCLASLEQRLRGARREPPREAARYSDKANLFAAEIYLALGLNYGRTMAAREHGCFAARWTEVELASLPPPMAECLWDHAVRAANKLGKRRRLKKPGGMFCRIWSVLLAQAKAGALT